MIVGPDPQIRCNDFGHGRPMIAILYKDRQKDNCGWDLEFPTDSRPLCVEVKGLAAAEIAVELIPNEYKAMNRAMHGTFTEGDYRLAVVCKALSNNPQLRLFTHEKDVCWRCERA